MQRKRRPFSHTYEMVEQLLLLFFSNSTTLKLPSSQQLWCRVGNQLVQMFYERGFKLNFHFTSFSQNVLQCMCIKASSGFKEISIFLGRCTEVLWNIPIGLVNNYEEYDQDKDASRKLSFWNANGILWIKKYCKFAKWSMSHLVASPKDYEW